MKKLNLLIMIVLALAMSMQVSGAITHRYDFAVDANDVVGGLESVLVGDAVVTGGSLVLDGVDDILEMDAAGIDANSYDAISMEMWYTPVTSGNTGFTMLAYLGGNNASTTWMGINYFMMTSAREDDISRAAICTNNTTDPWATESSGDGPEYDDGLQHHMVASLDDTQISLFIDGELMETSALSVNNYISAISTELALLGRGGYLNDPEWNGSIHEFRIYNKALNPGEVAYTNNFGPDDPKPLVLRTMSPAYGAVVDKELGVDLAWTMDAGIPLVVDSYNLYVGIDPNVADPNVPDVSGYSDITVLGLVSPAHTLTSGQLAFDTPYYWRVDTIDDGAVAYQGVGMTFTTLPETPFFVQQPAAYTLADAAGNATISVVASNTDYYRWYHENDSGTTLSTTNTLTLTGAVKADEGNYYCEISSDAFPTPILSDPGRLMTRRLASQYPMEVINVADANSFTPDTIDGYDMHLTSTGTASALLPTLEPNVISGMTGTNSLLFANASTEDPNRVYCEVPGDVVDYEDITIAGWYFWRGGANWQRLWDFGDGTDEYLFLAPSNGTNMRFAMRTPAIAEQGINVSPLAADEWVQVTFTLEGNTGTLYVNGDFAGENTAITINPTDFSKATSFIAKSQWPDPYYDGMVDDLRIYSYALTEDEVATLYYDVTGEYVCVEDSVNPLTYDVTGDCRVNLDDIAAIAGMWVECERVPTSACSW